MVIDPTSLAVNVFSGGNGCRVAGYRDKVLVAFDLNPKHAEARILIMKRYSFDRPGELFQVAGAGGS
jgi:hypothetical protein